MVLPLGPTWLEEYEDYEQAVDLHGELAERKEERLAALLLWLLPLPDDGQGR